MFRIGSVSSMILFVCVSFPADAGAQSSSLPKGALLRLGADTPFAGGPFYSATFSRDGKYVAAGGRFHAVTVYDRATAEVVFKFPKKGKPPPIFRVSSLAFSPDARRLAAGATDGTVYLHDLQGASQRIEADVSGKVYVGFANQGKVLYTCGQRKLAVWDISGPKPKRQQPVVEERFRAMAVSPDGKTLATVAANGKIELWDLENNHSRKSIGYLEGITVRITFSADGRNLITSGSGRELKLWEVASGEPRAAVANPVPRPIAMSLSADLQTLLVVPQARPLQRWNLLSDKMKTDARHVPSSFVGTFSTDGKYLALAREKLLVLDLTSKKDPYRKGHYESINSIAFSPDGKRIATCGWDKRICVWDARNGRLLRQFEHERPYVPALAKVAFLPGGKTLLAYGYRGEIEYWNAQTGKPAKGRVNASGIADLAFSANQQYLAIAPARGNISLHHLKTGAVVRSFKGHDRRNADLDLSADGRYLVTGGWDKKVNLWDVKNGQHLRQLGGPFDRSIKAVAFSPDSKNVAIVSGDIRIIRVKDGKEVGILEPRTMPYYLSALVYSPDGKMLLAGSQDGEIFVWDTRSGKQLHCLQGHTGMVNAIEFSPEGRSFATCSNDMSAVVWDARQLWK